MGSFIDLTGQRFGRLTVIEYVGKSKWLCKCDCGNEKVVLGKSLKNGHTKSCVCLCAECHNEFHHDYMTNQFESCSREEYEEFKEIKQTYDIR